MTLTELKYIVAVARERHFGKAAEACHVSQPTLSVAVKKLEEELELKLFERSASEVSVTPLGEEVVRQAQAVLEQAASIREIAKRGKDPLAGALRLGVIYTIAPYLLPELVKNVIARTPQMPLMLQENFTVKLLEMLRTGEIDCAILAEPFPDTGLAMAPLYDEPFVAALPSNHPLAGQTSVTAEQLKSDGVDVLHTIGGDDTNTTAADLAAYLHENGYELTVVGLPKTIDNDVIPIKQSLGAWTAAEEAAHFAKNVIGEHRSGNRMLIVHEVMGRHCGWLTAAAAAEYRRWLDAQEWVPSLGLTRERWDIHAIFLPEMALDIDAEAARLRTVMDEVGNVNIFLSEGAGMHEIVAQLEAAGEKVQRDPFGHVKLDTVNPGKWFAKQFASKLGAEKTMVQKSGYYSRAAAANAEDLRLIKSMTDLAVECALRGESGVIGHDEEDGDRLKAIAFPRIAGGKPFDTSAPWFGQMLSEIGQTFVPASSH